MAYDETNRGVLFKNEQKRTDKSPDYSGKLNVDGNEYFLDAWIKSAESGRKFMSVSVKLKEKQAPAPKKPSQDGARARQLPKREEPDDFEEIPF